MDSSATSSSAIPFNNAYPQNFQQQSQPSQYWTGSENEEIPSTSTANNREGFPLMNMPQQQFNQLNQQMSNEQAQHAFYHQHQMHVRMMQGSTGMFNGENIATSNGFNEASNLGASVNQNNGENNGQQHQSVADIMASINIQQHQNQQISTPSPGLSSASPHLRPSQIPSSLGGGPQGMGVPPGMIYSPQNNPQVGGTPNGFSQVQFMNAMQQSTRMPPHMMPNGQIMPNGFNNGAGSVKSAYVFDSEMANRASAEVVQKKFDTMVNWHSAHINPMQPWPPMTSNNWPPNSLPSTSTASSMNMMINQMNGVGTDIMSVGSPRTRTPNGTTGRGIKRRATPALDQQNSVTTPSPHLSQENLPQQQSNPNSVADHLLMQQQIMTPNNSDFLRPGSSHIKPTDSLGYGTNFKTLEDDPLKKIEQMTKLCDSPISHKIPRTCPTESEPKSKEQKLAKLNEIQQSLESRSYPSVSMNGPAVPPGMRPPPNFYGPPGSHLPPGLGPPNQGIDPHVAAMFRQQQAMYQQQMQQQQMNAYGGLIPQHLRGIPQPQLQQSSPSFTGLPLAPPGNTQTGAAANIASMQQQQWTMMQMHGQGNGHPGGFDNGPIDMQSNILRGGPPNGTGPGGCEGNFPTPNCWPPQHQMPQPLANLDARVPIQKMQYFANNVTPSNTQQPQ